MIFCINASLSSIIYLNIFTPALQVSIGNKRIFIFPWRCMVAYTMVYVSACYVTFEFYVEILTHFSKYFDRSYLLTNNHNVFLSGPNFEQLLNKFLSIIPTSILLYCDERKLWHSCFIKKLTPDTNTFVVNIFNLNHLSLLQIESAIFVDCANGFDIEYGFCTYCGFKKNGISYFPEFSHFCYRRQKWNTAHLEVCVKILRIVWILKNNDMTMKNKTTKNCAAEFCYRV